jgi:hypothetical protein
MQSVDIPTLRLFNQHLSQAGLVRPEQVVSWLGAVQAQDYAAAKWAVGLRLQDGLDDTVEQAFAEGRILRTHMLRPTWHFVMPEDIRWILELTSPRVQSRNAPWYRRLELDKAIFKRSEAAMAKALRGGKHLTRAELAGVLKKAGISGVELRFTYLLMHAELEGLICSGARRGKQFTHALLEERAPAAKSMQPDEALAELAHRYFTGHGPAALRDFTWWSSLAMADAKRGMEMVASEFASAQVDGQSYWFREPQGPAKRASLDAWLLPNFDEYIVGYTERGAVFDPLHDEGLIPRNSMLSHHTIVLDGQVVGTWKRSLGKDSVVVELSPFEPLARAESMAVKRAAARYAAFLGLALVMA